MVNSKRTASAMQKILEAEGILVKIRNVSEKTKGRGGTFEVLVLESESDLARDILLEKGL